MLTWQAEGKGKDRQYKSHSKATNNTYEIYKLGGEFCLLVHYDSGTRQNEVRGTLTICKAFAQSVERKKVEARQDAF